MCLGAVSSGISFPSLEAAKGDGALSSPHWGLGGERPPGGCGGVATGKQRGLAVLGTRGRSPATDCSEKQRPGARPSQVLTPPAHLGETGRQPISERPHGSSHQGWGERVQRRRHPHWNRRRGFCDVTRPSRHPEGSRGEELRLAERGGWPKATWQEAAARTRWAWQGGIAICTILGALKVKSGMNSQKRNDDQCPRCEVWRELQMPVWPGPGSDPSPAV